VRTPDPRAHWALLGLLMAAVLSALVVSGFTARDLGPGQPPAASADAAMVVGSGGPLVYRTAGGTLTDRRLADRTVALTFDDGPDPTWTPQILDVLRRAKVPATFFVVGAAVLAHPSLVRQELAAGDEVGADAFVRTGIPLAAGWQQNLQLSLDELALAGAVGETSDLVRPQYTTTPDDLTSADLGPLRRTAAAGYVVVLYDRDSGDASRPGVPRVVAGAEVPYPAGGVVLFHDGGGNRAQTVAALSRVIEAYKQHGYRFVTVSQALGMAPLAALAPVSGLRHAQGVAFGIAFTLSGIGTALLFALLLVLAGLTLPRAILLLVFARRHARRARRRVSTRSAPSQRALGPVTVVVPARDEAVGIAATVESLVASDYPDVEVIVVDDGSTDGTGDIVESLGLRGVRVIRQPNSGKAVALEAGLAAATTEIVAMVDADTVFEPESLGRLVAPLADESVFNLDRRLFDLLHCMPTVPGAIGAYRRRAVLAAGGVSSDTLAEDTDLTMALQRAGWRVVYEESARAWTEAPASLGELWRQRYRWCYGTMQAIWKHRQALVARGRGRALGRVGLPYLLLFQVLLPLLAPVIDLYAVYGVLFLDARVTLLSWGAFLAVQAVVTAYALHLDREPLRGLWVLPLQQFVYRQLMYLVIVQSTVSALGGARLRWHKLHRSGEVAAASPARLAAGIETPAA
jgi:cellulose synthase/poly-beta-1,6-N-acetylglucosamine synthase-like glycosyltransferase/peptidoglycan/xylan/chitin deacetylase (PgdA/CDA1 family)